MVRFTQGDLLEAKVEALVNAVNCVGRMGKGIALQFKMAYPRNFTAYAKACRAGLVRPGRVFVFETGDPLGPKYIVNFPTKRHWRDRSRYEDIAAGLDALVREVERRGIRSLALPALGCGLGGLDWAQVRPMIEAAFSELPEVDVLVFEPLGAPRQSRVFEDAAKCPPSFSPQDG